MSILPQIFISQNFFKCKLGYFTHSQTNQQFQEAVELFRLTEKDQLCDQRSFLNFMSFFSVYIESDSDFESFIDSCFRFYEVKMNVNRNQFSQKSKSQIPLKSSKNQQTSLYDQYQEKQKSSAKQVLDKLYQILLEKHNRGFLNFYFRLKQKESLNDLSIFFDDLNQVLESSKCYLTQDEAKELFREYSNGGTKMKTKIFIEHLIPFFNKAQSQKIDIAFQELQEKGMVSFLKIQNFFNPKAHPDTVNNDRTEYESKAEFLEFFHKFSNFYQGNGTKVERDTFFRFFEMYCQGWDDQSFDFFLSNCFSKQSGQNYNHHQNIINKAPFATDELKSQKNFFDKIQTPSRLQDKSVAPSQRLEPSHRETESYVSKSRHGIKSAKRLND